MKQTNRVRDFLTLLWAAIRFAFRPEAEIASIIIIHAAEHLDARDLHQMEQYLKAVRECDERLKANECSH